MLVAQLCPTLCDPMDSSPPGSSVHGVSRQEYWQEFLSPGDLPDPGIEPASPVLQVDSLLMSHWGSQKFTKRLIQHEQVRFIEAV